MGSILCCAIGETLVDRVQVSSNHTKFHFTHRRQPWILAWVSVAVQIAQAFDVNAYIPSQYHIPAQYHDVVQGCLLGSVVISWFLDVLFYQYPTAHTLQGAEKVSFIDTVIEQYVVS
jgi:hypothetical protein